MFARGGGGHVAFYIGEDVARFYALGGNQGDKVSIVLIVKDRMIASRWPMVVPATTEAVQMVAAAAAPSNEA